MCAFVSRLGLSLLKVEPITKKMIKAHYVCALYHTQLPRVYSTTSTPFLTERQTGLSPSHPPPLFSSLWESNCFDLDSLAGGRAFGERRRERIDK